MSLFAPPRCFDPNSPELMDRPGIDPVLVREELQILECANRRFGGHRLALQFVQRLLSSTPLASVSILDLGTGLADIPRIIVAWARARRLPITVCAVDGNSEAIRLAREACADWPEIRLEQHDLRELPYAAESFDLAVCSLALHHFARVDAVAILRRMNEIARMGLIVNDLRRNWPAIWITELLARTVIRSEILRHDALQSCRAAFTMAELSAAAREAALVNFQVTRHHGMFRMVLEARK
jgi:2-polyprenyl-3-methyl-5-hydroxy-6-metoxy-1,4-benzoquinol methylase